MESKLINESVKTWNGLAENISFFLWIAGGFTLFIYLIRLVFAGDMKSKYDLISRYEVRFLLTAALLLVVGGVFYLNSNVVKLSSFLVAMRVILGICGGLFVMVIIQSCLKYYYPFFMEKRLKRLRYTPRISPQTGKEMVLLSEEEEDAYLEEGMIAEESVFSVDYDVWKDPETNYVKIERYAGNLHALVCPECAFQTLKLIREEVIQEPTLSFDGELIKHYECSYCKQKMKKTVVLKSLSNFKKD